jgi:hypothetical protein
MHSKIPKKKKKKTPGGLRWLAVGRKCVLRLLQDRLTWLLNAMSPGLRVLWTRMQEPVDDTKLHVDLPILDSSANLISLLVHFNRTRRPAEFANTFTHDVTNCYTNIPQDDLVERLTDWLRKVWNLHPNRAYIKVSEKKGATWLADLPPQGQDFYCQTMRSRVHVFDLHTACLLVTLIVRTPMSSAGLTYTGRLMGSPWARHVLLRYVTCTSSHMSTLSSTAS